jgi:hypothetical protein
MEDTNLKVKKRMECATLVLHLCLISKDQLELALKCGIKNTSVTCFERITMYKKSFVMYIA